MEFVKSTIEHREPIIVGFFILQYAKLRMLELYYTFFDKFCDVSQFEELEMHTDSLYLALAEEDLDYCILTSKRAGWTEKRSKDCRDDSDQMRKTTFPPVLVLEARQLEGHICGCLDRVKTLEKQHKQLTILFGNL